MNKPLRWSFNITACTLLVANIALAQETPRQEGSAGVTIVTAGDISVTRGADGKAVVVVNFVPGKGKTSDTRITISGPYSLASLLALAIRGIARRGHTGWLVPQSILFHGWVHIVFNVVIYGEIC